MSLTLRPAAVQDIEDAAVWYEAQEPGLGDSFLDAVQQTLDTIPENPQRNRVVHRDVRCVHLRRFPYRVFYRIVDDGVVVVGCFHGRRHPRRWESRT